MPDDKRGRAQIHLALAADETSLGRCAPAAKN